MLAVQFCMDFKMLLCHNIFRRRKAGGSLKSMEWERPGGNSLLLGHSSGKIETFDLATTQITSEVPPLPKKQKKQIF